jgi:epoxyqueuosine reductase
LLPGASSIARLADLYPSAPPAEPADEPNFRAVVARYAWGDDYHQTIKKRLHRIADALTERFPGHQHKCTVDTAPILEREHAARAGLGWIGKHTLLIHPKLGSYLLLGEIITTLPVEPDDPADLGEAGCGTCTRCIDACPTHCISPYQLDASRCISYLTIEHRDLIDPALHASMDSWIAGCDICQQVCPFNAKTERAGHPAPVHPAYTPRPPAPAINLLDILNWTAANRRTAFTRSALKRIRLDMLKRNALIAAGNDLTRTNAPTLRERISQIAADPTEPPLVRQTAKQVIRTAGEGE